MIPRRNYPFDEAQASRLLCRSRLSRRAKPFALEIWSATQSEAAQKELNEVKSQLERIGIPTTIHFETNWPNFESMFRSNKAPIFVLCLVCGFSGSRIIFSAPSSTPNQNIIYTAYHHPEVDRLLDKARTERDYLKRMEMYRKIEEMILDDAPIVPMVNHLFQMVYQPYVRGIEVNALGGPYIPMKKIWLKKGE